MFSLSSLLESRNCVLQLRAILDWQRILKNYQTTTGGTLYPELRDKERTQSWCSTWQNRRARRVPHSLECVEEMLQESWLSWWALYRYSRSISQRSSLSWFTTRNRMDRRKVQRVGRTCKRRPYISPHSRRKEKIPRTMASHLEQIRQKWAYETSIRFSSCCLYQKSSTPRVRRTSWRADFS